MKRLLLASLLGISTLATRADFRDLDNIDSNINVNNSPLQGEFNLVTADVPPGSDLDGFILGSIVSSALVKFELDANGAFTFNFHVDLDDLLYDSDTVVGPNGSIVLDGDDGFLNGSTANEVIMLNHLKDNGKLTYKIYRDVDEDKGTLHVSTGDLKVLATDVTVPPDAVTTPDAGSTLGLAGIGLAAIASLRKKLAK